MSNGHIEHAGIKGMKWGVRKSAKLKPKKKSIKERIKSIDWSKVIQVRPYGGWDSTVQFMNTAHMNHQIDMQNHTINLVNNSMHMGF